MPEKENYTISEVAVVLGISYLRARRLVVCKKIPSIQLQGRGKCKKKVIVVPKKDLINYINKTVKVKG